MPQEIIFQDHETDIPAGTKDRIAEYVAALKEVHNRFVDNFEDALSQLTTTVSLGSEDRAAKDLLQRSSAAAIGVAIKFLWKAVGKKAPGVSLVVDFWNALSPEFAGGSDSRGKDVADWIHNLTEVMNGWRSAYDSGFVDELTEEITLQFLEADDPTAVFDELIDATDNVRAASQQGPGIRRLELGMYEAWINSNFDAFAEDGSGVIDIRLEADSDGASVVSCTIQAPHGAKLAKRLNVLLGNVSGFKRVADLKVTKRVAVCADGIAGGKTWHFGWTDAANKIVHEPLPGRGRDIFLEKGWQNITRRFFEAENSFFENPTSCSDTGIHTHAD